jgi:hypothetical protein
MPKHASLARAAATLRGFAPAPELSENNRLLNDPHLDTDDTWAAQMQNAIAYWQPGMSITARHIHTSIVRNVQAPARYNNSLCPGHRPESEAYGDMDNR